MSGHVERAAAYVRGLLEGEGSGHDWWHVERVWRTARMLAAAEGADAEVVELAALLHDVGDWKLHGGDEAAGPRLTRAWLEQDGVDPAVTGHVVEIVRDLSFKGAGVPTPMRTIEGKVVQDADRLDAIGAIGIARAFAYGGSRGRPLHDPEAAPVLHASFAEYKAARGGTLAHFSEKLLLLRDRMNTDAARRVAAERHRYLQAFVARFLAEWAGEDVEDALQ